MQLVAEEATYSYFMNIEIDFQKCEIEFSFWWIRI